MHDFITARVCLGWRYACGRERTQPYIRTTICDRRVCGTEIAHLMHRIAHPYLCNLTLLMTIVGCTLLCVVASQDVSSWIRILPIYTSVLSYVLGVWRSASATKSS